MSATSTKDERATAGQSAEGMVDKASGAMRDLADQTTEIADRAIEQGRELGAKAQQTPAALREAVDQSLSDQPMATLAVVAALGFVLGALWKS
jgi:ElaB/YqjD/DUF883 family membrane-anchored ribosome-binding protein